MPEMKSIEALTAGMDGLQDPDGKAVPSRTGLLMHVMERGDGASRIVATQNTEIARR